jgi:hypothetical protein
VTKLALLLQALGKYDSDDNLVAACWGCNFGKYHFTLEQLGLVPPRKRNAIENEWQGLTQWL